VGFVQALPRDVIVGTIAIFFRVTSWLKVPAYVALGQFTIEVGHAAAGRDPVDDRGRALVKRWPAERFYIIYVLMIGVGPKLIADAIQQGEGLTSPGLILPGSC